MEQEPRLGVRIVDALALTDAEAYKRVEERAQDYFSSFAGRWFDRMVDRNEPDRITRRDLVAVSMLSTPIAPHAAAWMLTDGAEQISRLLAEIPTGLELWEADQAILDDDAPLGQLWHLLQVGCWPKNTPSNGVGPVGAGKLLAAKRPDLVPIFDDFVDARLQPPPGQFWKAMRNELLTPEQRLEIAIAVVPIGSMQPDGLELSFLREIDIAVWTCEWYSRRPPTKTAS